MGICEYGLYMVTNGSGALIGQDFPRLGSEGGFHSRRTLKLYFAVSPIFSSSSAPIGSFNQPNDFRYRH